MRVAVKHLSYPLVVGTALLLFVTLATTGVAYWPLFPLVVVLGYIIVALLERAQPYELGWLKDHGDTLDDALHLTTTQILVQASIAGSFFLANALDWAPDLWPRQWPIWAQILLAGGILDFGLYVMHRYSHVQPFLWRLHAIHHSPQRLYWLNGGRRHVLSGIVLAGPSLVVLMLLGATPIAVGAWLSLMSIHLAFQHANLDYRLGPFRHLLGVAEMHRWHHKREYENAQVNFGEVWLIWDWLFGTHHESDASPRAGEVGLLDEQVPRGYLKQLRWPFRPAD